MCGLVGVYGNVYNKEKTAFKWLLYFDVMRGPHSTGIAAVHMKNDERTYRLMKETGEPYWLYHSYKDEFDKDDLYKHHDTTALIGHNRWATVGAVNNENAHPFDYDNLIGAHNGTVQMHSLKGFVGYDNLAVDSQIIFAELDAKNDIEHVWKTVDGAMALTWWDKRNDTMNLVRNKERPLHYAFTKDGKSLFWASEAWMLTIVLGKCGIDAKDIQTVPENKLLTFHKDGFKEIEVVEKDLAPFVKPVVHYQPFWERQGRNNFQNQNQKHVARVVEYCPANTWKDSFFVAIDDEGEELIIKMPYIEDDAERVVKLIQENVKNRRSYYEYYEYATYWRDRYNTVNYGMLTHKYNMISKADAKEENKEEETQRQVLSFQGEVITRAQWKRLEQTCVVCARPIHWRDAHKVFWIDDDYCACDECKDAEWVREWSDSHHASMNLIQ